MITKIFFHHIFVEESELKVFYFSFFTYNELFEHEESEWEILVKEM